MIRGVYHILEKHTVSGLVRRLILGWLVSAVLELALLSPQLRDLNTLAGIGQMSLLRVMIVTAAVTVLLWVLSRGRHTACWERWGIVLAFFVLTMLAFCASSTWPFCVACIIVFDLLVLYALMGWNGEKILCCQSQKVHKGFYWAVAAVSVAFFLFVSVWGMCRIYSFSTPSFDFGLFAQMFHSMKSTGLPMTTLERDGLLSHFAVHVSPIYYLMLPVYWLVPMPATLQVLQALVLTLAVIPLWKITKHHGFSGWARLLCCLLLLLYPAYAGGTSYDLHENCFLTPLILWMLYGMDRKHAALTVVAAILTLMVKEDAAVYVAVAALFLITKSLLYREKKSLFLGVALLVVSLGWFFAVTGYLASSGDGVMTNRYQNFIYDGSGSLVAVVKAVIMNPMKLLYECMDREKLEFIALTLLPLMGLPLLTRRYERYILLIPYLLVNLMSDYTYQHDIFFQYTYGSTAFLIYLTAINLADWKSDKRRLLAMLAAVVVALACFGKEVVPKAKRYPEKLVRNYVQYEQIRAELAQIPEEAAVASATYYTTHLCAREVLYDIKYCSQEHLMESEYVVLDPGVTGDFKKYADEEGENGYQNLCELLQENGYELQRSVDTQLEIYHKENAGA